MNRYAQQAMSHWRRWLPQRYVSIPQPERFFTELGEQVESQIIELTQTLAGDDPPGEGYMSKLGRLNMARLQAEEIVLGELVLLPAEPGVEEGPQATLPREWADLAQTPEPPTR
ncbi:hypothetical protein [Pseudonocardia sp. N23]|uniref:hypothetical protein n=1 Tax=Pseudonocardia sp. N23 TaxID=1987376 RepID=UPI000C02B787|nr:hypothetical protein [Pseudonocardia sp. N23]GAY07937.1 hypothetical protein TOK_5651 [Pseudonocardia sp. N23]